MNAIDFVVRTRTGAVERGSVAGDNQGFLIDAGRGNDISLNIRQEDLRGYDRAGNDLLITLADGRVVVLEGYFAATGSDENRLFLSADSELSEVSFVESDGGALFAQYGPTETWGKWSPSDQLIFFDDPVVAAAPAAGPGGEEVSMLAAGLLGSTGLLGAAGGTAALVGAAALAGGGGGGGGGSAPSADDANWVPPSVHNADGTVPLSGSDAPVVTVTGTANPGSEVVVVIGGETVTTTANDDSSWQADFDGENFPPDGTYEDISVVVTDPDGTVTTLDGPTIVIDTTPPLIEITEGTVSTGDLFNGETHISGVTLNGTGEPGASVTMTVGGVTETFIIAEAGGWSITFDETVLPGGEYTEDITIVATDSFGNSTTITDQIEIDTVPHPIAIDAVGGDDLINIADADAGFDITGTTNAGAVVTVTFGNVTQDVTADANGVWTLSVTSSDFEGGEYDAEITASTVDAAGNASSTTSTVSIDTISEVTLTNGPLTGDDMISESEYTAGTTLEGTTQPGSTVQVTIEGTTLDATVAGDGTWTVTFGTGDLAPGTYTTTATITATDAAGNSSTATHTFDVDTEASLTINTVSVETDGVVNAEEASDGVELTGTSEPGASVEVTAGTVVLTTTADAAGSWSVVVPSSEFVGDSNGQGDLSVTAVSTDAAGNTATATGSVPYDLITTLTMDTDSVEGDGIVNEAEQADGVLLTGTTEPGSTVEVTVAGTALAATVASDGSWQVNIPANLVPTGETTLAVSATSTDAAGNVATSSGTIDIDTVTDVTVQTAGIEGDGTVNAVEHSDGVTLTGTAQPGASVEVTMGTITHSATVDANGTWTAQFTASEIPTGETDVPVTAVATDQAGNSATATGSVNVDTLVTNFATTSTPGGADGVVNAEEASAGLTLTGTTEVGSTVMVTLGGVSLPASVAADGSWTVTYASGQLPSGEQTVTLSAVATDMAGNTDTISQSVVIDTDAGMLTIDPAPVETDDVVNYVEASDGVVLTGTSDPGAMVTVTMNSISHVVQTDSGGRWQAPFAAHEITQGTYTAEITATITDSAGNTLTRTDSVLVDTEVLNFAVSGDPIEGDNVVNGVEASDGVVFSGTTEPGGSVDVIFEGVSHAATVDGSGNWTVSFPASDIPAGEYNSTVEINTTDAAGNVATTTTSIAVDTSVSLLNMSSDPVTDDDVVNAEEADQGITLTGAVEPGSTVVVTVGGVAHTAVVDSAGNWTVDIPSSSIPRGTMDAPVLIEATDAAGNTDSVLESISIDTDAPDAPSVESYTRDHTGIRGISLAMSDNDVEIGHVVSDTTIENVPFSDVDIPALGETSYAFNQVVPDGSHLVVTNTDAAGNTSGTYLVVDDTTTSEVAMTTSLANSLSTFQIETIDLQFAEDSELTITEAQLTSLSSNTDTLVVQGGVDDSVTITGATANGTTTQDGNTFNVFSLGDATVLVEDDITNVII